MPNYKFGFNPCLLGEYISAKGPSTNYVVSVGGGGGYPQRRCQTTGGGGGGPPKNYVVFLPFRFCNFQILPQKKKKSLREKVWTALNQRFGSSTGNMEVLHSLTHSIVCACNIEGQFLKVESPVRWQHIILRYTFQFSFHDFTWKVPKMFKRVFSLIKRLCFMI